LNITIDIDKFCNLFGYTKKSNPPKVITLNEAYELAEDKENYKLLINVITIGKIRGY